MYPTGNWKIWANIPEIGIICLKVTSYQGCKAIQYKIEHYKWEIGLYPEKENPIFQNDKFVGSR